jgi:sugar phosphate isomerase/epimerase
MRIGIDSYCYHRYFGEIYGFQEDPGKRWSTESFVKRALELQVEGVSLETCFFPGYDLKNIKAMLDQHNLDRVVAWGHPDGLEGGTNAEALKDLIKHIDVAKMMGAKVMRVVGSSLRFRNEPHGPQIERLSSMFCQATKVAKERDVVLAMENHIDFTASEILSLIGNVDSDYFGVNFDTGNALRLFEDPVEEAKLLAPYVHATHIKDLAPRKGGSPREWNFWESVPCGEGVVDIPAILRVLEEQGYQGTLCVELDCLQKDWEEDQAVEISINYLRKTLAKL